MKDTSPERWREIEELTDRVLDAPEAEREAILAEAATTDPDLRTTVERLLAAADEAGDRFDQPPLIVAHDVLLQTVELSRDQVDAGDRIGAYRVTRLIGRGGMGAVYEAERADGAFEKRVAIKIVKRGMDTDEIIRRFHHERRILARLEHPNIAGIVDGGITDDGLPYFVMELAHGERIDEWCDNHTLVLRERLVLFEQVCEAVQYAHGNLIVHRDIKPGNIVVADDGVKLLDFGIAKLVGPEESPQQTQLQDMRLTPQYAAPEQIRNELTTTATDVYSLGVLLYELLCGRPPYRLDGRTMLEIERIICTTDPLPPSTVAGRSKDGGPDPEDVARSRGIGRSTTLQQQLRGDLDAICLKALRKAPDQRYVSAAALAEDIRRHLDGRAVRAHPPTQAYRFRKFVQRNRRSVLLGTIAVLSLMAALVTAIVLGRQAVRQRDLRQEEAARATAANDFILSTLGGFDPDASPGQLEFSAHDLVLQGQANLNALDLQPPIKASVMNTLGQVAFNLGERAIADSLFRAAHEILVANGGGLDLAVSMYGIGQVLQRDREFGQAREWYRRSLDLRRRLGADPRAVAESQQALAFASYNVGDPAALDEADRLYTELMTWPDSLWSVRAGALEGLADVEVERSNLSKADSLYDADLAIRIEHQGGDHPDVARATWGLVNLRVIEGRFTEAEQLSRQAIDILESAYGDSHRDLVYAYLFLGTALNRQGEFPEAAEAFRHAAEMSASENVPGHPDTGGAWAHFAEALMADDRPADAERAFRSAREIYLEGLRGRVDSSEIGNAVAQVDTMLARLLIDRERMDEAIELLDEAVSVATDSTLVARVRSWLETVPGR